MKKTTYLFISLALLGALELSSCSSSSSSTTKAMTDAMDIYGSMGGDKAVSTIVDKSLGYASGDSRVAKYLTPATKPLVQTVLTSEVCKAIGGPCDHSAISLTDALKGTGFNAAAGNALMENIGKSMDDLKVPAKSKDAAMGSLGSSLLKGL
jgi:hemoglobin